jgi:uracil-DNA glycosylase family 4
MSTWAEKSGALCGECPLASKCPVPPELPAEDPPSNIYYVTGNPGSMEEIKKRMFTGESGMYLDDIIDEFAAPKHGKPGLYPLARRARAHLTATILCRPRKHFTPKLWKQALQACQPRMVNELKNIPEGSVIMALGPKACGTLTGNYQVAPWRGYPLPAVKPYEFLNERRVTIMPMFAPDFILKAPAYTFVFRIDFYRALLYHEEGFKPYVEVPIHIEEGPEMEAALERIAREAKMIGLDVESAGTNAFVDDLLAVGMGTETEAVSVPWPPRNSAIEDMTRVIVADERIVKSLHNANHDLINLEAQGIEWNGEIWDTLPWHRILYPLLKHDLGFAVSLEIGGPRWKTIYKKLSGGFNKRLFAKIAAGHRPTILQLRHYNGQDSNRQALLHNAAIARMMEAT